MKIYFAGPLFTPYERDYISRSAQSLREHGLDSFVPHESPKEEIPNDTRSRAKRCYDNDFGAIYEANAMLAIVNGAEVDDGTATEIGIFYALMQSDSTKKGVVALHDDWRTKDGGEGKGLNAFVLGCVLECGVICHTLEDAIKQLESWNEELRTENPSQNGGTAK